MGLDLYFYRCKKECYAQLSHAPQLLSAETRVADERWIQKQHFLCGDLEWFSKHNEPLPRKNDAVILVGQWLQHVGAAYRWLVEHTSLTMADVYPVAIERDASFALRDACKTIADLVPDDDGNLDTNICEHCLPAIDEANCEYYHPAMGYDYFGTSWYGEEFQEEAQSVLDTLNLLLKTIDFEKEVVLVQASW